MQTNLPQELKALSADPLIQNGISSILEVAHRITGDPSTALALISREPLRIFDGATAVELALRGRALDVVGYLESIEAGASG